MTCDRPLSFLGLLLLIPAILFLVYKNNKNSSYTEKQLKFHKSIPGLKRIFNYKKILNIRIFFLSLTWIMLIFAYAGIYWGTYLVPVQKNGTSVSFVFDISNSMNATDGPSNMTRLKSSAVYAQKLINSMNSKPENASSVSIILSKGDGITAIPLTQDYAMIESLLSALSSKLMTAPGTSLEKGILKAKESFPTNFSSAGRIWVFTDGEETDGHFKNALTECIKAGIPVTIIGFGQETETTVLAGDGKTSVKTALRTEKILQAIEEAKRSSGFYMDQTPILFINANEKGSAVKLLSQLKTSDGQIVSYEAKPVPRYKLFLFFALVFFLLSYFVTELDFSNIKFDMKKTTAASMIFFAFIFTGCNSNTTNILKGAYAFNQKQYGKSVSSFLTALNSAKKENDKEVENYALLNLGTSYSMLDEDEAAIQKFSSISKDAPENVRFAAFYNTGIIYHRNGNYDKASENFKKALEIDSSNLNAKINLELSIQLSNVETKQNEATVIPTTTQTDSSKNDLEDAIFEQIKENDTKQWKNSETTQTENLANDF